MLTVTLTNLFVCVRLFYVRVQCCQRLGLGGSYTAWTARDRREVQFILGLPQPLVPIRTFWLESTPGLDLKKVRFYYHKFPVNAGLGELLPQIGRSISPQ